VKKIALIEDDPDLFDLLQHNLRKQSYEVTGQQTGEAALEFLRRERPDLLLLDVLLPGQDGIEICKQVKADQEIRSMPVMFLSALDSETDRVLGLEMGAEDYVVKPFSMRELLARIKARLRSQPAAAPPPAPEVDRIQCGPLELDPARHSVRLQGRPVELTATEFRLLEHFMRHPGLVFQRSRLLDAVWTNRTDVMERTVDAYVVRLRNKLEDEPTKPRWIESMRGVGYRFRPES